MEGGGSTPCYRIWGCFSCERSIFQCQMAFASLFGSFLVSLLMAHGCLSNVAIIWTSIGIVFIHTHKMTISRKMFGKNVFSGWLLTLLTKPWTLPYLVFTTRVFTSSVTMLGLSWKVEMQNVAIKSNSNIIAITDSPGSCLQPNGKSYIGCPTGWW